MSAPKLRGVSGKGAGTASTRQFYNEYQCQKQRKMEKKAKEHMTYWYPVGIKWHKTRQNVVKRGKTR